MGFDKSSLGHIKGVNSISKSSILVNSQGVQGFFAANSKFFLTPLVNQIPKKKNDKFVCHHCGKIGHVRPVFVLICMVLLKEVIENPTFLG